jgi:hypothetical protein
MRLIPPRAEMPHHSAPPWALLRGVSARLCPVLPVLPEDSPTRLELSRFRIPALSSWRLAGEIVAEGLAGSTPAHVIVQHSRAISSTAGASRFGTIVSARGDNCPFESLTTHTNLLSQPSSPRRRWTLVSLRLEIPRSCICHPNSGGNFPTRHSARCIALTSRRVDLPS